ncbi:phage tail length tape measure family protein [Rhizobium sp. LEGMi12c]
MTDIATLGVKFTIVGADQVATGMNRVAVAANKVESEVGAAARAIGTLGGKAAASTGAIGKATAGMIEWKNSCSSTAGAVDKVAGSLTGMNAESQSNQNSIEAVSIKAKDLKDVLIEMGTRMASGDSPFMIALQQGGKLGEMFSGAGGLTGIVKGLGNAFLTILNPIGLVTQALTFAGAAAVQYFLNAGRDVKSVDEILKRHAEHIAELGPTYQKMNEQKEEALKLGPAITNANLKDDYKGAQKTLKAEGEKASRSILADMLGQQAPYGDQIVYIPPTTFDPAIEAIDRFNKSIESGKIKAIEFQNEIIELQNSGKITEEVAGKLREYSNNAVAAQSKLSVLRDKIDPVAQAFAEMQDKVNKINPFGASKLQEPQRVLDDLLRNLQANQISAEELNQKIRELSNAHPDLSQALEEIRQFGLIALQAMKNVQGLDNAVRTTPHSSRYSQEETVRRVKNFDDRFGPDVGAPIKYSDIRERLNAQKKALEPPKTIDGGAGLGSSRDLIRPAQEATSAYDTLQKSVESRIEQMQTEAQAIGLNSIAVETLKMNLELLRATEDKSHAAAPGQIQDIKNKIAQYNALATATANAKLAGDIQFQQDQMGRSTVDQTVASTQKQYGLPVDMNSASANIIRYNEQLKYARELAGDFASTLVSGLRNGEGLWKSLGKAAISVLTKISDRLLNDVLNSLFKVNSAAAGGGLFGGGGIFGGLFGGGGGLDLGILARSPQAAAAVASGIPGLWADGGYTGPGGKHEPAGIVHAGEVVWSQKDIARAGGVGVVEAMRLGRRGYADGGVVGEGGPQLLRAQPDVAVPVRRLRADNQNDASGSASGVHVTVGVSVDEDGNLKAYVKNVAQSEAQSSTRQGLNDFNQQLPDRVAQINRNPRRR